MSVQTGECTGGLCVYKQLRVGHKAESDAKTTRGDSLFGEGKGTHTTAQRAENVLGILNTAQTECAVQAFSRPDLVAGDGDLCLFRTPEWYRHAGKHLDHGPLKVIARGLLLLLLPLLFLLLLLLLL